MNIFIDFLVGIFASEAYSALPWLQRKILRLAVALLAPTERAMRSEEWEAVLLEFDIPGEVWRTGLALGFLRAGMGYRCRVIADCLLEWGITCIRLGVSTQQLRNMLADDLHRLANAITDGLVEVHHFSNVRIGNHRTILTIVYKGWVPCSTCWDRGEWWKYLSRKPSRNGRPEWGPSWGWLATETTALGNADIPSFPEARPLIPRIARTTPTETVCGSTASNIDS